MYPENFNEKELAEIGKAALTNKFGGDEYEAFTGASDMALDFHGGNATLKEEAKGHVGFRCEIKNKLNRNLTVVILPAYFINSMAYRAVINSKSIFDSKEEGGVDFMIQQSFMAILVENGINADIILLDGKWYSKTIIPAVVEGGEETEQYDEIASVSTSMPGKTCAGFLEFVRNNPTRIPEILIQSNTTLTYQQIMRIKPISPVRELGEKTIHLTEYFDQKMNRVDFITVPTHGFGKSGLQFDDQTLIIMEIPAAVGGVDTTVGFTFKFGVSRNQASELATKAAIAKSDTPVMMPKMGMNMPALKLALNP